MGLLEKAGQINAGETSNVVPAETEVKPQPVAAETVAEPEPVQSRKRSRRKRAPRKKREPREKKFRSPKILPDGFELASNSQRAIKRIADFAVSWGWCVPLVLMFAWGSWFDPTYFVLLGLGLMAFNLGFMPRTTNRTVGNWISRTNYINNDSKQPHQTYVLFKGLTFAVVLVGILLVATSLQDLGERSGQILMGLGLAVLLPPFLDYLFYRFKSDNLGLWDTIYGGVWMVKTTKSAQSKGWLKRLEQLGDYSESQGWWSDKDSTEDSGDPVS